MNTNYFIKNRKYFMVLCTSDYATINRVEISFDVFKLAITSCLEMGFGCEHRFLMSNEFGTVEKDIFYANSAHLSCYEFMYEKEYL